MPSICRRHHNNSKNQNRTAVKTLDAKARRAGLPINAGKTKYMVMNESIAALNNNLSIELEGCRRLEVESVGTFVYLGALMTKDGSNSAQIRARIVIGYKYTGAMR